MILKYLLMAGVAYLVYKGINPLKKVNSPKQEFETESDPEDFTDYEELD